MRSYLIEDFFPEQLETLQSHLAEMGLTGGLEGIYYLPLPETLLSDEQLAHGAECGPHVLVLEILDESSIRLELLVRARGKLRCSCVAYATPAQRAHMTAWLDDLLDQLGIAV